MTLQEMVESIVGDGTSRTINDVIAEVRRRFGVSISGSYTARVLHWMWTNGRLTRTWQADSTLLYR